MRDLIWAGALFVPLIVLVLGLLGPARRAIAQWGDAHAKSAAERDAAAQRVLADVEGDRHQLAIDRANMAAETERERARLAAETAQYETDRKAAEEALAEAVEARKRVIAARAEAEAALAPDAAKSALQPGGDWLAAAYRTYCENYEYADPLPFGRWIQGFEGVPRG
jgi:hypothetical protein